MDRSNRAILLKSIRFIEKIAVKHQATNLSEYTLTDNEGNEHIVYGSNIQDAYRNMLKLREELNKPVEDGWLNDWPRCETCGLLHPGECIRKD